MVGKKSMWVLLSAFIIAAFLLGSSSQVMAETWKAKFFNKVTKMEAVPVPDAEGHWVGMMVREGTVIFENGEMGWNKTVVIFDGIKGAGPFSQYGTTTFKDGSTISGFTKGTSGPGIAEWTGEIIHGTGRFQGIKGSVKASSKYLPPEKGEAVGKGYGESTITFTLPPK